MNIVSELSKALDNLRQERLTIDDRIAALELAVETLGGAAPKAAKVERVPRRRIRRDVDGLSKALAWMAESKSPVTAQKLARGVGCTYTAARVRLNRLTHTKQIVRVSRGVYLHIANLNGSASRVAAQ